MSALLVCLIFVCGAWAVAASLLIARDLERRGVHVSYLWLRVMMLKYLSQYRWVTLEETGHVGSLLYHYVIPLYPGFGQWHIEPETWRATFKRPAQE